MTAKHYPTFRVSRKEAKWGAVIEKEIEKVYTV
jgi:hypothetical protein